jgi:exopolysaccharide biosynthesis polyprenyl glycosylphosphotransferase
MLHQQVIIINNMLLVADALCVILAGYSAFYLTSITTGAAPFSSMAFGFTVLSLMFINSYIMGRLHLYSEIRPKSYLSISWALTKAVFLDFVFLSAGLYFFKTLDYSRRFMVYCAALMLVLILAYRLLLLLYLKHSVQKGVGANHILIVSDPQRFDRVKSVLAEQLSWGHQIVGRLAVGDEPGGADKVLGRLEDLEAVLRHRPIDEVVFAVSGDRTLDLEPYLAYCHKTGVSVRILPAMWSLGYGRLSIDTCQGVPFLILKSAPFNASGMLYKRILDLLVGLAGTLLFLIMYPCVALAIKLDSPGPVLFKQKRMGRHGRVFELYKFRTMCVDAEHRKAELTAGNKMNGPIFKLSTDPRVTRLGRFLRKTSIDEFPQFWNVLKGEMSLVGTRPPTLDEVACYKPDHLKRISAKPGITGLWQVSGRNEITDFDQIVELDCRYMDNWRFFNDLKILAQTIWVVLRRKGAF